MQTYYNARTRLDAIGANGILFHGSLWGGHVTAADERQPRKRREIVVTTNVTLCYLIFILSFHQWALDIATVGGNKRESEGTLNILEAGKKRILLDSERGIDFTMIKFHKKFQSILSFFS